MDADDSIARVEFFPVAIEPQQGKHGL